MTEIKLDKDQLNAVQKATELANRLVAVTGPAGSGKTTIMRQIYDQLKDKKSIALCAPTGKAARRIREATGIPAVTIHKLLEYNRPGERDEHGKPIDPTLPGRTRKNPLDQSVILVDEYAMVNYELHNNLIAALPSGGCVRAFGDVHQLPPIEPYQIKPIDAKKYQTPFEKILNEFTAATLDTIYRQDSASTILIEADRIRRGVMPTLNKDVGDFFLRITDRPVDMLRMFVMNKFKEGIDYRLIENQIITSGKKSWVGTRKLNEVLRLILNPNPDHKIELPRYKWDKDKLTVGLHDKVVCTENTYDLRPYEERFISWNPDGYPDYESFIPCPDTKMMLNGETGVITQIYPDGSIDVDFGDRIVEIPSVMTEYWHKEDIIIDTFPLRSIDLAYALTTHKCQGSEFANTCYLMNKSMLYTQNRNNFYTAVTRARVSATILTDQYSLRQSLHKKAKR